jgi:hypothetical protein
MNSCNHLRVALDLDDTIFDFERSYRIRFPDDEFCSYQITKNVQKLANDKDFWENLPLLERPNFIPHLYATKRINNKLYTKNCLLKHGLPIRPIYQIYSQLRNKADIIKGRCDVLIDDSIFNVNQAIRAGLPALLIDRPNNQNGDPLFRIYSLDIDEIIWAYNLELSTLQWN